jgi:hypothetical protein
MKDCLSETNFVYTLDYQLIYIKLIIKFEGRARRIEKWILIAIPAPRNHGGTGSRVSLVYI